MQSKLQLYNTLTRKKEPFKPIKAKQAGIYSCGPTVYNYAHIGNLRTYLFNDILKRSLSFLGFKVNHVMNITDVDDKTIKASQKEKTSLKNFTREYEKIFFQDLQELNIIKPTIIRATESIPEMVSIIERLLKKKYAYKTPDGIYFSISKFKPYGKLAGLSKIKKTKERISSDEYEKSTPQDFALWKFYTPKDGDVFWDTKIGKGRPGWHIECSAMSMKLLGNTLDIHTGATDLTFPHHTNEIAQSEGATGKKFVNHWLHAGFLKMQDSKMSKSLGNVLTLNEIKSQGFKPIHFRLLVLQTHYKKPLNFSLENLDAAKTAFNHIKRKVIELKQISHSAKDLTKQYQEQFQEAISDDLNTPKALNIFWQALDDPNFSTPKKLKLLLNFDEVLGLNLKNMKKEKITISSEVKKLLDSRERFRKNKLWERADVIRQRIHDLGFRVQDTAKGPKLEKL
tara:strand:+ start:3933 stop:5294 length:1362 start_codon:yes stop_codon:yes gene_type:complete